jgi:hypothetical protein
MLSVIHHHNHKFKHNLDSQQIETLKQNLAFIVKPRLQHNHVSALWQSYACLIKIYKYNILTYSDWLRARRSGDRIPVGARFSAPVQTGRGAHPASCTMGTGSFPGVESGRGVTLTPHPLLVPRSKNRVELYLYSP